MEGQFQPALCERNRLFIILPILLTLFTTNIYATNEDPTTKKAPPIINTELTFSAVPIIANTVAAYRNLVTAANPVVKIEVATPTPATEASTFTFSALSREERRQHIANVAESYTNWGFRYQYGGTSIEKGIDCSAFTRFILNYFDIKAPRTSDEQYGAGEKIPVSQAQKGDLVFFGGKNSISHVAMVYSNDEKGLIVVHSCNSGIKKENISQSSYWRPKLKSMAVNLFDAAQDKSLSVTR
jgi:cell wall-associated NlpC family hydrolase